MTKAVFVRKPADIEDLKGLGEGTADISIQKVIELSQEEYEYFSHNLLEDFDFIAQNIHLMGSGVNTRKCILIKAKGFTEGILVESSGYDYARYAAYYKEVRNG